MGKPVVRTRTTADIQPVDAPDGDERHGCPFGMDDDGISWYACYLCTRQWYGLDPGTHYLCRKRMDTLTRNNPVDAPDGDERDGCSQSLLTTWHDGDGRTLLDWQRIFNARYSMLVDSLCMVIKSKHNPV